MIYIAITLFLCILNTLSSITQLIRGAKGHVRNTMDYIVYWFSMVMTSFAWTLFYMILTITN